MAVMLLLVMQQVLIILIYCLFGKLQVLDGIMNVGPAALNVHNDIEYAPVGQPTIEVQGGILNVNGQIRRNTSVVEGH